MIPPTDVRDGSHVTGPLAGLRVVEIASIGPGPFCAMLLSDMGAEVIRVDKATAVVAGADPANPPKDILNRGRRSLAVDLKSPGGVEVVLELASKADALIEGFRPGVMERLGLGPQECRERNPKLVYGRMTGWGQTGPLASAAGHDINFVALSGALEPIGRRGQPPTIPLNLVGDFGGGGLMLAFGIVCALLEAANSGQGQVVDAAMVEGAAYLTSMVHSFRAMGMWNDERGTNLIDGGAPFYDVYECADGKYVSIGPIEPQFYALFLEAVGLDEQDLGAQYDKSRWPMAKERIAAAFKAKPRDEWQAVMEGTDICFAPVLSLSEAPNHPHNKAREAFVEMNGVVQPSPSPRFSRTPPQIASPPAYPGQHTREVLADWGFSPEEIETYLTTGAIAQA